MAPSIRHGRWSSLAAFAIVAFCASFAAARPVVERESAEPMPTVPAPVGLPQRDAILRQISNPDSDFGRMLHKRLASMTDDELIALDRSMPPSSVSIAGTAPFDDDEMMMADMPSAPQEPFTTDPSTATDPSQEIYRNRMRADNGSIKIEDSYVNPDKEEWLKTLKIRIMSQMGEFLGSPPPINSTKPHINASVTATPHLHQTESIQLMWEKIDNFPSVPLEASTEKTQSFYPACGLPRHTDEQMWNSKQFINLFFNTSSSKTSSGASRTVIEAKLRLFKQLVACQSQISNETTDDTQFCQPMSSGESGKRSFSNSSESITVPFPVEENQIRVSVYMYTRALKKKRVKTRLLDSRMLSYFGENWTEWNIKPAMRAWRQDPLRNFGIRIEVEDEEGNQLPTQRFFKPMKCSDDAQTTTPKPVPWMLVESMPGVSNISELSALSFNPQRYPMVDVTTVEVPESVVDRSVLYQYAKMAVGRALSWNSSESGSVADSQQHPKQQQQQQQHRIRHNGDGHKGAVDPAADGVVVGFSKDGRDLRDQIIERRVIARNMAVVQATTTGAITSDENSK